MNRRRARYSSYSLSMLCFALVKFLYFFLGTACFTPFLLDSSLHAQNFKSSSKNPQNLPTKQHKKRKKKGKFSQIYQISKPVALSYADAKSFTSSFALKWQFLDFNYHKVSCKSFISYKRLVIYAGSNGFLKISKKNSRLTHVYLSLFLLLL